MREDPRPQESNELVLLEQYLDFQRETVLLKCEGLTKEQLGQALPPSTLTLAGLLHHLAVVEEIWSRERFSGLARAERWASVDWAADPDWEFRTALDMEPEQLKAAYRDACESTRQVVRSASGPDQLSAQTLRDGHFTLRWMLLHLIEETARHAGHADLLREAVDGSVGE